MAAARPRSAPQRNLKHRQLEHARRARAAATSPTPTAPPAVVALDAERPVPVWGQAVRGSAADPTRPRHRPFRLRRQRRPGNRMTRRTASSICPGVVRHYWSDRAVVTPGNPGSHSVSGDRPARGSALGRAGASVNAGLARYGGPVYVVGVGSGRRTEVELVGTVRRHRQPVDAAHLPTKGFAGDWRSPRARPDQVRSRFCTLNSSRRRDQWLVHQRAGAEPRRTPGAAAHGQPKAGGGGHRASSCAFSSLCPQRGASSCEPG
jgi:hypothetical protein